MAKDLIHQKVEVDNDTTLWAGSGRTSGGSSVEEISAALEREDIDLHVKRNLPIYRLIGRLGRHIDLICTSCLATSCSGVEADKIGAAQIMLRERLHEQQISVLLHNRLLSRLARHLGQSRTS